MSPSELARPSSIDAYLTRLRVALGHLPEKEIEEILREFRGHIQERQDAANSNDDSHLTQILGNLGMPEDIGALYRTEALVVRARSTFSPVLIVLATARLAGKSLKRMLVFLVAITGYAGAAGFLICAAVKPFLPERVGLWVSDHHFSMGVVSESDHARELLGWWMIPVSLCLGFVSIIATTAFLRWMLQFHIGPRVKSRMSTGRMRTE